jgi:DNA polymerase III subunit epsilon
VYCIVDIETTGGVKGPTRMTEIALIRFDGREVVDTYQTLLNPGHPIPPFIVGLTGISDDMVAQAPTFDEVAHHVQAITDGAIFVAHNVSFDFNFLKKEFGWLDLDFHRRTLCTVRLSRKIFPGLPSYSLGKLCRSLEIPVTGRHRAHGDALATTTLFGRLLHHDRHQLIPRPANWPPVQ